MRPKCRGSVCSSQVAVHYGRRTNSAGYALPSCLVRPMGTRNVRRAASSVFLRDSPTAPHPRAPPPAHAARSPVGDPGRSTRMAATRRGRYAGCGAQVTEAGSPDPSGNERPCQAHRSWSCLRCGARWHLTIHYVPDCILPYTTMLLLCVASVLAYRRHGVEKNVCRGLRDPVPRGQGPTAAPNNPAVGALPRTPQRT